MFANYGVCYKKELVNMTASDIGDRSYVIIETEKYIEQNFWTTFAILLAHSGMLKFLVKKHGEKKRFQ